MKEKKLVYGVGINDADYVVQKSESWQENGKQKRKLIWACPYYDRWNKMIKRCYSEKYQVKNPTYKGCHVYKPWLIFSNFKSWMENQNWEGMQLDKDILFEGNKEYHPDKCVFVHRKVNTFLVDRASKRGEYKIGVYLNKTRESKPYQSQCCNPFTRKQESLGRFSTEKEAHEVYRKRKYELAIELANSEYVTDERVKKALIERFKY